MQVLILIFILFVESLKGSSIEIKATLKVWRDHLHWIFSLPNVFFRAALVLQTLRKRSHWPGKINYCLFSSLSFNGHQYHRAITITMPLSAIIAQICLNHALSNIFSWLSWFYSNILPSISGGLLLLPSLPPTSCEYSKLFKSRWTFLKIVH